MVSHLEYGIPLHKISKSWCLSLALERINHLLQHIPVIIPSHVRRSTKKLVDNLANEGIQGPYDQWDQPRDTQHHNDWTMQAFSMATKDCQHPYGVTGARESSNDVTEGLIPCQTICMDERKVHPMSNSNAFNNSNEAKPSKHSRWRF
jgi:hypothetical protein